MEEVVVLLASSLYRLRDSPPQQKVLWFKMSVGLRLRHPILYALTSLEKAEPHG